MKKILLMFLLVFFTVIPNMEGKNDKSSKGQEKKEWAQDKKNEDKEGKGRSEDAKKNWGQLKDEYNTKEEREEVKSMIQHKKRLRNILYDLGLDYKIDTEKEYNNFMEFYYSDKFDLTDREKARIEEEILKFQDEFVKEDNE